MVLVPTQGLDGSLLPAAALPAVAWHGSGYYERAGYHSAVFVEANLTAAEPGISGAPALICSLPQCLRSCGMGQIRPHSCMI